MQQPTIPFRVAQATSVTEEDRTVVGDEKGLFSRERVTSTVTTEALVPVESLKANISDVTASLSDALEPAVAHAPTGLHLSEVCVQLEVTAEGRVNLIGVAGSVGATAGITLRFSR